MIALRLRNKLVRGVRVALLLGAGAWARPALADPPPDTLVFPSANPEAEKLLAEAHALLRKGDVPAAYDLYRRSFILDPTAQAAANLGIIEVELGRPLEAAIHLGYAIRNYPPSSDPAKKAILQRKLASVRPLVGLLRIDVPEGAAVAVDGHSVLGIEGTEIYVEPGKHRIDASRAGYKYMRFEVEVAAGGEVRVAPVLDALPEPAPNAPSSALPPPLPTATKPPQVPLDAPPTLDTAATVGVVITGVGMLATFALVVVTDVQRGEVEDQQKALSDRGGANACAAPSLDLAGDCAHLSRQVSREDQLETLTLMSGGAVFAVGLSTLAYVLVTRDDAPAPALSVTPTVSPTQAGLDVVLSF